MMPEAFQHGGRYVGLLVTAGFGLAFAIGELGVGQVLMAPGRVSAQITQTSSPITSSAQIG